MLAGYGVFLALYVAGHLVRGWRILWIVAAFDLLAIGFVRATQPPATFFIYGAAMLGHAFPPRRAALALVVQVVLGSRRSRGARDAVAGTGRWRPSSRR